MEVFIVEKNKMCVVLCIIGIIFGIISVVLALSGTDIKYVCSSIFLTLCFVTLSIVLNNRNKDK